MKLRFAVNQAAALRDGYNAPSSTVDLDIDPVKLSQPDRAMLAEHLHAGISVVAKNNTAFGECEAYLPSNPTPSDLVVADAPTLEALLSATRANDAKVAAVHADGMAVMAEKEKKEAAKRAEQEALCARVSAEIVAQGLAYPFGFSGTIYSRQTSLPVPSGYLTDAAQTVLEAAWTKYQEDYRASVKAHRAGLLAQYLPYMTEVEKRLESRGKLELNAVTRRLKNEACSELEDKLDGTNAPGIVIPRPLEYRGDIDVYPSHSGGDESAWKPEWLSTAEAIEAITGHPVVGINTDCLIFNTYVSVKWQADPLALRVELGNTPVEPSDE